MITNDIVQEVFNNTIYPDLKKYVESKSLYNPLITKVKTSLSNRFPIISVKLLPNTSHYNNLSYGEETFDFGIEMDINCQDKSLNDKKVSKQMICEELTSLIVKYFKENFRMTIYVEPNAVSTDTTVHRAIVRASGTLDTKYGLKKLVVYPR